MVMAADILSELAEKQPRITRIDDRWGEGRYYQIEGIEPKLPSVTTVLNVISKPALIPWAKKVALESVRKAMLNNQGVFFTTREMDMLEFEAWTDKVFAEAKKEPEKVRSEAANFGTRLHALIDEYLKGPPGAYQVPDELAVPFNNFLTWRQESGLTIHLSEVMVYSSEWGFAGTLDGIATRQTPDGKELIVIDWKTSNKIYEEHAFQVAAYALGLEEMLGHRWPVSEAWVLRLGKDKPEFEAKLAPKCSFNGFEGALTLFNGLAKVKEAWKEDVHGNIR